MRTFGKVLQRGFGKSKSVQQLYERTALTVCALALTILTIHSFMPDADAQNESRHVDELTVRRLKIVDASGTVRLLLTGKPLPEGRIDGKVLSSTAAPRQAAGLLFYNDRGDEQGGLIYSGYHGEQGGVLTFDAWRQDQALQIQHADDATGSDSYIAGRDRPKTSLLNDIAAYDRERAAASTDAEREKISARWLREGRFGRRRFLVGEQNGVSQLTLDDAQGQTRLRLRVTPKGDAAIQFLNKRGVVVRTIKSE